MNVILPQYNFIILKSRIHFKNSSFTQTVGQLQGIIINWGIAIEIQSNRQEACGPAQSWEHTRVESLISIWARSLPLMLKLQNWPLS